MQLQLGEGKFFVMELLVGFGARYARAKIVLWVSRTKAVMLQSFKGLQLISDIETFASQSSIDMVRYEFYGPGEFKIVSDHIFVQLKNYRLRFYFYLKN